ncbi:Homoserine O-acetyltransferase [Hondaea fermentalgiana]|uniref:Homoserine O-acetyltransferase n=1 Tax=Hondaea fermentalgiana TaxID=2315210 RepID=A0A2R5FZW8_9STRA|nr:Homoserine O-acetyltransferase [Hondaea fermentalgiana]|eukprot:GBG24317.1 Homoserine O-acetyltransferase [Hondaea fermentalgiana]
MSSPGLLAAEPPRVCARALSSRASVPAAAAKGDDALPELEEARLAAPALHQNDGDDDGDADDEDEYKRVDATGETFLAGSHKLENGLELQDVECRYRTFGTMNEDRTNVLVVCHALTGNAALDDWWGSMLGPGKLFDDSKMFVVCINVLGSCYGTTSPVSINPKTGKPYGRAFPDVTVRDSVSLHLRLVKEHLGAKSVACVVGGSLGGMQTLEWAALGGDFVKAILPMSCGAYHHPWQIAISEAQRQAIYADSNWHGGDYHAHGTYPAQGLSVARAMAMISYRTHAGYGRKFGRRQVKDRAAGQDQERFFQVESYLRHQGAKFVSRFDALSYVKLTRMMDTHDLGRNREGGVEGALHRMTQPTLIVSATTDALYPPEEQQYLHEHLPNSELFTIDTDHGHDGFLLCQEEIIPVARAFLDKHVYGPLNLAQTASS